MPQTRRLLGAAAAVTATGEMEVTGLVANMRKTMKMARLRKKAIARMNAKAMERAIAVMKPGAGARARARMMAMAMARTRTTTTRTAVVLTGVGAALP